MDGETSKQQTVDELLEVKGKDLQESVDILRHLFRNYFTEAGYSFPNNEEELRDAITDKYLRLNFNMVELARYHNLTSLLICMRSLDAVHDQFRAWVEAHGGSTYGKVLEEYETESVRVYQSCRKISPSNLLGKIAVENEINIIRDSLSKILESFENIQRLRTHYVTLNCHDNAEEGADVGSLRDLDVDWKELVNARETLPHFLMLDNIIKPAQRGLLSLF